MRRQHDDDEGGGLEGGRRLVVGDNNNDEEQECKSEDDDDNSNGNPSSSSSRREQQQQRQNDDLEWKKYSDYGDLDVDRDDDDKAKELRLGSFARPHMRAFHCAWISFFAAFFLWFSQSPLLSEIRDTSLVVDTTTSTGASVASTSPPYYRIGTADLWTSSIASLLGGFVARCFAPPLCRRFGGARTVFAATLCATSVPAAAMGLLVHSAASLSVLRFLIGLVGGTFVTSQYWLDRMFTRDVLDRKGGAKALVAGWGNLGGGVAQIFVGTFLFPLFKRAVYDGDSDKSWRTILVVPAFVAYATGILVFFVSDDTPKGNLRERRRARRRGNNEQREQEDKVTTLSLSRPTADTNTWLLVSQYACCFGVELTMNNALALYYRDEFGLSTESAAAIAFVFGFTNLFARGLGGYAGDWAFERLGMRGALIAQTIFLACEGILVLVYANQSNSLAGSIVLLSIFSVFVQASKGSTYNIVPYVDPANTDKVSSVVATGGMLGGLGFSLVFRLMIYEDAFVVMGATILCSSILSGFISIPGFDTMY